MLTYGGKKLKPHLKFFQMKFILDLIRNVHDKWLL